MLSFNAEDALRAAARTRQSDTGAEVTATEAAALGTKGSACTLAFKSEASLLAAARARHPEACSRDTSTQAAAFKTEDWGCNLSFNSEASLRAATRTLQLETGSQVTATVAVALGVRLAAKKLVVGSISALAVGLAGTVPMLNIRQL